MAGSMRLSLIINADGSAAITGLRRVQGEVNGLDRAANNATSGGLGTLTGQLKSLAVTAAAGIGIAELTRAFIDATQNAHRLETSLTAVTGSTQAAAAEMDYIKATADRMGLSVNDVSGAYVSLTAAAKGTSLEGQATRDIFEAVALAMAKLGKSSADTQGALLGLEQLMGQTTANLEDLRQVTDRIPSGMKLAADGMGMTVEQMKEMISKGEILVTDIVPGLASQLRAFYDDGNAITGLQAEWNKFTNALGDVAVGFDRVTDATTLLGGALAGATELARGLANALAAAANARDGLGLTTFANDAEKLASMEQRRLRAVQDYADAVRQVEEHSGSAFAPLTEWAANVEGKLKTLQQVSQEQFAFARGLEQSAAASKKLGEAQAQSMGDDAVARYEKHRAVIDEANQSLLKLNGTYDASVKRQYQVAEATKKYQEIAKSLGKDEAWVSEQVAKYTASLDKSSSAKGRASSASKGLAKAQREENQAIQEAERAVQGLIARYLPARAAAEDYAEAQAAVAAALAGRSGSVALSAEEASKVLDGLARDQAQAAEAARREADGFYSAWADAVDSLDNTFQSLWRSLITGQGNVLENLTETVLEWVADLSYQLLLKPLIVPIQANLLGMAGGTGTGGMGGIGTGGMGGIGGLSGIGSWFSGTSYGTGIANLFGGGTYDPWTGTTSSWATSLSNTPNWNFALSNIAGSLLGNALFGGKGYGGIGSTIGSTLGSALSSAFLTPILGPFAPLVGSLLGGAGGGFLGSLFGDSPSYGNFMAVTGTDRYQLGQLEDSEAGAYATGGFGLTFGLSDKYSGDIDANELKDSFQAMADLTQAIADFFGPDLAKEVEDELKKLAENSQIWMAKDFDAAVGDIVTKIADAAGKTGKEVGVAFDLILGSVSGTAKEVAVQVEQAMGATLVAIKVAENWQSTMGDMLGLTGTFDRDIRSLVSMANSIKLDDESTAEALARMVAQMQVLSEAAFTTGQSLERLKPQRLVQISDDLSKLLGGAEQAATAIGFYVQNFMTAGEIAKRTIEGLTQSLQQGWEILNTTDFAKIGEILDLGDLPQTRDDFRQLVDSIDLTTKAGRALYAELMKLAPGFDALFDAAESFQDWIDPAGKVERATARVTAVFKSLGLQMPANIAELQRLYESGKLTTEQMAILAAIMGDLQLVFGAVGDTVQETVTKIGKSAEQIKQEADDLTLRRLQLVDPQAYQDELRRRELANTDPANRDLLEQIYYIEDEQKRIENAYQERLKAIESSYASEVAAINGAAQSRITAINEEAQAQQAAINDQAKARIDAINAEREAANAAHEAQMDALQAEARAAQETLSAAQGMLSSIQSALGSFRNAQIDELSIARANRQLAGWVASGALPDQDALDRVLGTLSMDTPNAYATERDYMVARATTLANLKALEAMGLDQVDYAQQAVDELQSQQDQLQAQHEAQMAAFDAQLQTVQDWREAQIQNAQDWRDAQLQAVQDWRDTELAAAQARHEEALAQAESWRTEQLELLRQLVLFGGTVDGGSIDLDNNGEVDDNGSAQAQSEAMALAFQPAMDLQTGKLDEQLAVMRSLRDELAALRADQAAANTALVIPLKSMDDRLRKWDGDGLPSGRDDDVVLVRAA